MKNTKNRFPLDPKVNWWRLPEELEALAKKVNEKPYQSFTALLTQAGGSSIKTVGNSNGGPLKQVTTLYKGATYTIDENPNNTDLSALGAPNSSVGTSFMAILDADLVTYNLDVAVVLSFNQGGVKANVLENTIGNIWFTYSDEGLYFIESNGLFSPSNKSCVAHSGVTSDDGGYSSFFVYSNLADTNDIRILVTDLVGVTRDNVLNNYLIEIKVYN